MPVFLTNYIEKTFSTIWKTVQSFTAISKEETYNIFSGFFESLSNIETVRFSLQFVLYNSEQISLIAFHSRHPEGN